MSYVDVPLWVYPMSPNFSFTGAFTLDAVDEVIAFVLPIPKSGTIKKIGFRVNAVSSPDGIKVRAAIETVADTVGQPVATSRAGATLYAAGSESAESDAIAATGVQFLSINGATGTSVTKGDWVSITIRVTSLTSGSISILYDQYGSGISPTFRAAHIPYTATYTGSWGVYFRPAVTLEYDGEFVPVPFCVPAPSAVATTVAWDSADNPDRRGLKFKFSSFSCKLKGCWLLVDNDADMDLILYSSDEYTVMTGFPITLDKDKRSSTSINIFYVEFPTEPTITANTDYRLALLPKAETNCAIYTHVPADDGAILGVTAYPEGANVAYTTFNGVPDAGSHAWTDDATKIPSIAVVISQIDVSAAGGGGRPEFRGSNL